MSLTTIGGEEEEKKLIPVVTSPPTRVNAHTALSMVLCVINEPLASKLPLGRCK